MRRRSLAIIAAVSTISLTQIASAADLPQGLAAYCGQSWPDVRQSSITGMSPFKLRANGGSHSFHGLRHSRAVGIGHHMPSILN
jgi:hypothetical protein